MKLRATFGMALFGAGVMACTGPMGPAGEPGTNGTNGTAGAAGATGATGPAGPEGDAGSGTAFEIKQIVNCSGNFTVTPTAGGTLTFFVSYQATQFTTGDVFATASIVDAAGAFVRGATWFKADGTAFAGDGDVLMDQDNIGAKNDGNFRAVYDDVDNTVDVGVTDPDVNGGQLALETVTVSSGKVCTAS